MTKYIDPFRLLQPFFQENKGFCFVQKEPTFDLSFRCRLCQNMGFVDTVANPKSSHHSHDENLQDFNELKEENKHSSCTLI